jgi:hypothetical protein
VGSGSGSFWVVVWDGTIVVSSCSEQCFHCYVARNAFVPYPWRFGALCLQVLFEQEPSDFGALLQTEKEANAKHQVRQGLKLSGRGSVAA